MATSVSYFGILSHPQRAKDKTQHTGVNLCMCELITFTVMPGQILSSFIYNWYPYSPARLELKATHPTIKSIYFTLVCCIIYATGLFQCDLLIYGHISYGDVFLFLNTMQLNCTYHGTKDILIISTYM